MPDWEDWLAVGEVLHPMSPTKRDWLLQRKLIKLEEEPGIYAPCKLVSLTSEYWPSLVKVLLHLHEGGNP